jgi:hypothetical protein
MGVIIPAYRRQDRSEGPFPMQPGPIAEHGSSFADDLQQFSGAGLCDLAAKVSIGRYRYASVAELISGRSSAEAALIHPCCE